MILILNWENDKVRYIYIYIWGGYKNRYIETTKFKKKTILRTCTNISNYIYIYTSLYLPYLLESIWGEADFKELMVKKELKRCDLERYYNDINLNTKIDISIIVVELYILQIHI